MAAGSFGGGGASAARTLDAASAHSTSENVTVSGRASVRRIGVKAQVLQAAGLLYRTAAARSSRPRSAYRFAGGGVETDRTHIGPVPCSDVTGSAAWIRWGGETQHPWERSADVEALVMPGLRWDHRRDRGDRRRPPLRMLRRRRRG